MDLARTTVGMRFIASGKRMDKNNERNGLNRIFAA